MRTRLEDRVLPSYTPSEESFNEISHIVGAGLSLIGMIACIVLSVQHHSNVSLLASFIYGFANILLYTMSSIYHGLKPGTAKKVFQILDHCSIYLMIAGTYTPIILCGILPNNPTAGIVLMVVEWGMALAGMILNAIDLKQFKVFSFFSYLIMGWAIAPMFNDVLRILTMNGFLLLLLGGIIYSIGAGLYALGTKKSYLHCVFHVCILIGSILHFIAIFCYVL